MNWENNNQTNKADLSNYVFSKVQPQALSIEEAVLGALLVDKEGIYKVVDILDPEIFYLSTHARIYEAIFWLYDKQFPIDPLTVTERLSKTGELEAIGGPAFLFELMNRVASSANIEAHCFILKQKKIKRDLIESGALMINGGYDDTVDSIELLEESERNIFEIGNQNSSKAYQAFAKVAIELKKEIEAAMNQPDGITGVPSGFHELDKLSNGWQPSDLIILAARPGMGKTSFVLSLAKNAAKDFGKGVAIFSLEMSATQLAARMASIDCGVSGRLIKSGQLEDHQVIDIHKSLESLSECDIFIDDTPGLSVYELRAKCRRLKAQHDIQMVVIDYLQLMTGKATGNREQEISDISRQLKVIAKELNIPVIALSQLSRAVEMRGGTKRPQLSDLRESGAIEQDADMVTFIYRPEYYNIIEDEEGQSLKGIAEIIVAKNRHGALKTVNLKWEAEFTRFDNLYTNYINEPGFMPGQEDEPQVNNYSNIITKPTKINDDEDIPF